ncbi:glycosyltransferase family 2 protein [Roseovarius salinarum]|uniref:glycosyltransferase family 2 protein n=1 Tax=Roseovarius salinarum TaxID=1981892 RepID=UPI000C346A10|nr:glycosyltransferase family 2 protein [Roseovarius salinarum]
MTPSVLTIILNYRTPELTLRAAEAAVREMEGIRGEIVVVDNGSADDSVEWLAAAFDARGWTRSGAVTFKQTGRNGGFGAGNNFAIRAGMSDGSAPDFVYLLNSDAWPQPGAIRRLLDHVTSDRACGIAGSFIEGPDKTPHTTAFRFPSAAGEFEGAVRTGVVSRLLRKSVVPLPIPDRTTRVGWVAGASAMIRRRMLDEIGLFDETFFLYYEETDLCLRAARAGWQTHYVPASVVTHVGSASTGMKLWRRTPRYWFDSRLHYFVKNHGRAYAAAATLARMTGAALWRMRVAVSSRPLGDPPNFLWDLTAHSVRGILRRPSAGNRPPAPPAIAEKTE